MIITTPTVANGDLLQELQRVSNSITLTGLTVDAIRRERDEATAFVRRLRHYVDTVDRDAVTVAQVLAAVDALLPTETPARTGAGAPPSKESKS